METKTVYIKMPVDLLAAIRQLADSGDRSINAQIVRLLRQQLEQGKKEWESAAGTDNG